MNHSFSKTKFTDNQLRSILRLKDLLTCNKLPDHLLDDIYHITTSHNNIKELLLSERVKIERVHNKYCETINDKRMVKIRLYNDNEFATYENHIGHAEIR